MKVYNSLYDRVDDATKKKIEKTFASKVKFVVPIVQKQQGYKDCSAKKRSFLLNIRNCDIFYVGHTCFFICPVVGCVSKVPVRWKINISQQAFMGGTLVYQLYGQKFP